MPEKMARHCLIGPTVIARTTIEGLSSEIVELFGCRCRWGRCSPILRNARMMKCHSSEKSSLERSPSIVFDDRTHVRAEQVSGK